MKQRASPQTMATNVNVWMVTMVTFVKSRTIASLSITVQMEPHVLMVMIPTHATVHLGTLVSTVNKWMTVSLTTLAQMEQNVLMKMIDTLAVSLIISQ